MKDVSNITADAVALQEIDEFREQGWTKVLAPAKVNLHLAIGVRRPDGYHDAATVLHAINLHDIVYLRRKPGGCPGPEARMVSKGGIEVPDIPSGDNIATKAVLALAELTGREHDTAIEIRIEKNIPAQAGLGGGSADAAATLVGCAKLWGIDPDDPAIEQAARQLGADVAFFIHGGCAYLEGTGDTFVHGLKPSRKSVALVKPEGGVSTGAAYRTFDEAPSPVPEGLAAQVAEAQEAEAIAPFNNLAPASEKLMPELAEIRSWLLDQPGVKSALLCGSGSCTFAICGTFSDACQVVASARKMGYWARATSFGSARAAAAS